MGMVKISVLYAPPADPAAFEDYYATTHEALVAQLPHVLRVDTAKAVGTPDGQPAPYYRTADLLFSSIEDLQACFASPQGQAVVADLPNFATGGAHTLICALDRD